MKSIVAQTESQLRPVKVSRLVSVLKGSLGESLGSRSAVGQAVAQMMASQVEFRWTPHLSSLVGAPSPNGETGTQLLWRPYVNFNTRLTRKLSGAMERRGSSINFLGRSLKTTRKGSSTCVLPVKTRHAPKTVQGGKWPIWRQSSMRPLLLPSSNLWTGVLSQRFYAPRLRPADDEEEVERQAVPQLHVTREECEEEEQQLQRRRDGSRLRHPARERQEEKDEQRQEQEQEEDFRQEDRPYVPSELMTPELASKWQTTSSSAREHREQQLLNLEQQMKILPSVRMTTQTWVSGNQRRYRSRQPGGGGQRIQVVSELEGWRRSANHQPVPVFQGQPAEQEHLRHASCKTSARSMKDVQESSKMVWEPEERSPWGRTVEIVCPSARMPTIRAAQSALMMAQESRSKHHRLITKELVYRPSAPEAVGEQEVAALDPHHRPTGGGGKRRVARRSGPERALLQQHLADLLAAVEPNGSFRIGYQPNAPTRQLLEQGKCHVSLRREQFIHLQTMLPKSLIQAADLEVRESPRQSPVTTLHRRDGAKRPRPVELVVKPSLLTVIRQEAVNWDHNGQRRGRVVDKRSNSVGVRPKKVASLRRLVRSASSLEAIVRAQQQEQRKPKRTAEPKPQSSVSEFHNVVIKKLPQVTTSKLDICKAAHPFKDLEEPRTKEKEVAASWKQAHVARNYKYEASTSYRSQRHPGKRSSTKDMTEGYFLAKRSSSTAIKGSGSSSSSSKKVKPPRQPVVSPKVQVPSVQRKQRAQEKLSEEAPSHSHQ
ncbi:hypothetical protein KR084_011036, partial [Drosophila pseudotakahashii]